jgi:hypothetical protein
VVDLGTGVGTGRDDHSHIPVPDWIMFLLWCGAQSKGLTMNVRKLAPATAAKEMFDDLQRLIEAIDRRVPQLRHVDMYTSWVIAEVSPPASE